MTWISGIVMRRDIYLSVEEPQKDDDTHIPQVYLQLEMLKQNPEFAVLYGRVLAEGSGERMASGFNFGEVFIKNYLDILMAAGIPAYLLSQEKKRLAADMIYDRLQKITKYHYEEPYYEEVVAKMKEILQEAGDAGDQADAEKKDAVNQK